MARKLVSGLGLRLLRSQRTYGARLARVGVVGPAIRHSVSWTSPLMSTAPRVKRLRQHVNPLLARYAAPVPLPELATVFADPSQPLHVDIGCGTGKFVVDISQVCRVRGRHVLLQAHSCHVGGAVHELHRSRHSRRAC